MPPACTRCKAPNAGSTPTASPNQKHGRRSWDHLRLPCFWFGDAVGVLPAFGAFTGMHAVQGAAEDRLFAVADNMVAAMPVASERFAA